MPSTLSNHKKKTVSSETARCKTPSIGRQAPSDRWLMQRAGPYPSAPLDRHLAEKGSLDEDQHLADLSRGPGLTGK